VGAARLLVLLSRPKVETLDGLDTGSGPGSGFAQGATPGQAGTGSSPKPQAPRLNPQALSLGPQDPNPKPSSPHPLKPFS
jgi:hypothetical protein